MPALYPEPTTGYAPTAGVQGIRWAGLVDRITRSVRNRRDEIRRRDADVTQRDAGGNPQGFWPAALRGRLPDVGELIDVSEGTRRVLARGAMYVNTRQVAQPQRMLSDPHPEHWDVRSTDALYFGRIEDDVAWARRFQVPRTTHLYNESWATNSSYGAQGVWSGPEGTLVLFPLHIPRQIGTRRAIGNSTINRPSGSRRVGIPGVTVVQAAGHFP